VRFFLDNDVPVSVRTMLIVRHHVCWTAGQAGLALESQDDNLSVYAAEQDAVLVTLDREFMRRRRASPIGQHIRQHVTVTVSWDGVKADSSWS
jgi:predicted nuclease of predicted toxin-antitoxin system